MAITTGKINTTGSSGINSTDIHPIVLDQLACEASPRLAMQIASHPCALKSTLAKLAQNESVDVRCTVGENRNTPTEVLWSLARDEHPDVRYSMAENHNICVDVLRYLMRDENPYVAIRAERTVLRIAASFATSAVVATEVNVYAFAS